MSSNPSVPAEGVQRKINLNPEQLEAVEHVMGPCFVCACPGSGKTRVIVERVVRLIEKGYSPRSILCITFTNKAANEMKERVCKQLGNEQGQEVYISTFHALCATVIRKYGAYIGYGLNTTILDDEDQEGLMAQCARQAGHEWNAQQIKALIWKTNELRENLISEDDFTSHFKHEEEGEVCKEYVLRMRKNNQIDFSGLLSEMIRLLERDGSTLSKLQTRFDFIQVDEAQDTNFAQFKIVQLLGAHNNVLIVGDPDQGIYSWRGARYKNIEDFININKAKVVNLPHNYRSTPEIVKVASTLIKHNKNRQQTLEFKTGNESGKPVECICLPTPEQEGAWIAHRIKHMIDNEGYKPHDFAVLYRINAMSRAIEQGLMSLGITYQVIGGFSFFDRSEIRDSLAMLRFAVNPLDGTALSRFINKPSRRIGEVSLGKIENFANDQGINLMEAMKRVREFASGNDKTRVIQGCEEIHAAFSFDRTGMSIGEVLDNLVVRLGYYRFLESKYETKELDDRKDNVQELINACALYTEKRGNDIAGYLNNIALQTSSDKDTEDNTVSLMSLHASKGLEFPVVFMPGLEEGQLPHKRALMERDGLDEERRLCYVGMTRAEQRLIVSFADTRMQKFKNGSIAFEPTKKSRFLQESGLANSIRTIRAR